METAVQYLKDSTSDFVGKIGDLVYQAEKKTLEKNHLGKFVVIDTERKEVVVIASSPVDAIVKARKIEDKKGYFMREIGRNTRLR